MSGRAPMTEGISTGLSVAPVRSLQPAMARRGLLVSALVVAVVWLCAAGFWWWRVGALSEAVARGEAEGWERGLRQLGRGRPPGQEELLEWVEENREAGLRGVGLISASGVLQRSAGTLEAGPVVPCQGCMVPIESGYRVVLPSPRMDRSSPRRILADALAGSQGAEGGPELPRQPGDPGAAPTGHRGPPARLYFEFSPQLSGELSLVSQGTLLAGAVAALALLASVALFSRLSEQAEAAERALAEKTRLAQLGEMSAVLAHEIRNPLAAVKGHAQLLLEVLPGGAGQRQAQRVVDATLRLENLSEELLDFVRGGRIERERADPGALLRSVVEEHAPRAALSTEGAPRHWSFDPLRLRQVLANLLDNARQTADEPQVEASVEEREGALWFSVRDRGPGVPEDQREAIFAPFHTTRTRGVGLGLAVARQVVELHGGRIEVRGREGGGAEFVFSVPA